MGLDASLYLAYMMSNFKFWMFHFVTMGIPLIFVYQTQGVLASAEMFSFCYGNLVPGSAASWIPVFASLWLVVSNIVFAAWRQKLMDSIKIEAGSDNIHSSAHTVLVRTGTDRSAPRPRPRPRPRPAHTIRPRPRPPLTPYARARPSNPLPWHTAQELRNRRRRRPGASVRRMPRRQTMT